MDGLSLNAVLQYLGIHSEWLLEFLGVCFRFFVMILVAALTFLIARKWLSRVVVKVTGKTATRWDDLMFDHRFFTCFALFVTPLVVQLLSGYMDWEHGVLVHKVVNIWVCVAAVLLISAVLDGADRIYNSYPVARNRPIRVFIQITKVFLYCIALIIVVSILMDKSPQALLVGLSAFAAVLMLIFKDAILGFVAGVQLIANRMVKLGDWIVMPSANADGEVLEINLTTVKVQNWDKTISTIPTYKMVSESFTNWRGMEELTGVALNVRYILTSNRFII